MTRTNGLSECLSLALCGVVMDVSDVNQFDARNPPSERGRRAARRAGGQDPAARRRGGAQQHLRGGLPWPLPWIPVGHSPHDALDALATAIKRGKVSWVLDADIRDFFGSLDRGWLEKFLEHRIADKRILRLVQKWLAAASTARWDLCGSGRASTRAKARPYRDQPMGLRPGWRQILSVGFRRI